MSDVAAIVFAVLLAAAWFTGLHFFSKRFDAWYLRRALERDGQYQRALAKGDDEMIQGRRKWIELWIQDRSRNWTIVLYIAGSILLLVALGWGIPAVN